MPFKSEKQRRYLWANEPEIARDWTDTYGSRVKKQLGGTLNIGYHGSPFYQNIMSGGFKGSRIPTWAGFGKTFTSPSSNVAMRYGVPLEIAQSSRNFTLPFGGGLDKSGISLGGETPLNPKQATKGMRLMEKLRSGVYSGSPMAQRLLSTGTTSMPAATTGSSLARALFGPLGLTSAYVGGASALQKRIPEELQGVISDDIISGGAMGAAAGQDAEWDAILRGSTTEISPVLQKAIDEGTSYNEWDRIPNEKYFGLDIQRNYIPTESMNDLYKTASLSKVPLDTSRFKNIYAGPGQGDEAGNVWEKPAPKPFTFPGIIGLIQSLTRGAGKKLGMTQVSPEDLTANQQFMQDQGISRDPQTGRMIGGDFAGMNAPGRSGWGSANFGEMAQSWMDKYGEMAYKTDKMKEKKARIAKIASDHQLKLQQERERTIKDYSTWKSPSGRDHAGTAGIGSPESRRGAAPGRSKGEASWKGYQGGLAGLWQR